MKGDRGILEQPAVGGTARADLVQPLRRMHDQRTPRPLLEMCSSSEEGSHARLIDFCITQL